MGAACAKRTPRPQIAFTAAHPLPASNLLRTLRLLTAGLCVLLSLINLPVFNGLALARALPDRQALIIRDGLLRKRWIKDIPTFEAEGHVWEDVRFVSCERLRSIPDGPPPQP